MSNPKELTINMPMASSISLNELDFIFQTHKRFFDGKDKVDELTVNITGVKHVTTMCMIYLKMMDGRVKDSGGKFKIIGASKTAMDALLGAKMSKHFNIEANKHE